MLPDICSFSINTALHLARLNLVWYFVVPSLGAVKSLWHSPYSALGLATWKNACVLLLTHCSKYFMSTRTSTDPSTRSPKDSRRNVAVLSNLLFYFFSIWFSTFTKSLPNHCRIKPVWFPNSSWVRKHFIFFQRYPDMLYELNHLHQMLIQPSKQHEQIYKARLPATEDNLTPLSYRLYSCEH